MIVGLFGLTGSRSPTTAQKGRCSLRFAEGLILGALLIGQIVRAAVPNDSFANRILLPGVTNLISASSVGAGRETGEPQHAGALGGKSVWWTWTAQNSGTVTVSTFGSDFDTLLGVYLGSSLTNLVGLASNDDFGDNWTSKVLLRAIAGETYQIAVDGFQGACGNITLRLAPSGDAPHSWAFSDTNGHPVSSADFPHKVVLLDFMRTTCSDCRFEAPELVKFRNKHAANGFEVIAVSKDELTVSEIVSNAAQMGINYPVVLNDPSVEASFDGPLPMPTKVLLDREGKPQVTIYGGRTFEYYDGLITPLLHGAVNLPVKIRAEPGGAVLAWPASEFGYVAEGSTQLMGGTWTTVSVSMVVTNGENTVTVPTSGSTTFYRLRKSQP